MVPFGNFSLSYGSGFGWLMVLLSFILMTLGIMRLVWMAPERRSRPRESTLDILKKRCAHGQISKKNLTH